MAFYVSVLEGQRTKSRSILAAGPFNRHGDAERCVGHVHHLVADRYPNDAPWVGFGTCRVRHGEMKPGKFNEDLGLPTDGRIHELTLPDNRWW